MHSLKTKLTLAITTVLMVASYSQANHRLDELRVGYADECTQLRQERAATVKRARLDHQAALDDLKCAERDARRLCEPERSCALAKIKVARRQQLRNHRVTLAQIRSSYQLAISQAKSRYEVACREVYRVVEVTTLPCGCPLDECSCRPQSPSCHTWDLPFEHSSSLHQLTTMIPEVFRVQTTRVVPAPTFRRGPVIPAPTCRVGTPSYKQRTVTRETVRVGQHPVAKRPVGRFLEALMTSL